MISITPAIKSLKIRNLGIIRKADFKFTKGINIIYGVCGSGKTIVVNAISHLVNGEKLIYGPNKYMKSSEKAVIEIELLGKKLSAEVKEQRSCYEECLRKGQFPNGQKIPASMRLAKNPEELKNALSAGERIFLEVAETLRKSNKGQAILLDDVFAYLDRENIGILFELFRKSGLQVITTAKHESELVKGANVLRLENPMWKK